MANPWFQMGGPFGPIAPGVSPMVNPATMLGFSLWQQQPLQGLTNMAQLQQQGAYQQAQMADWEAQRQMEQEELRRAQVARANQITSQLMLNQALARQSVNASKGENILAPDVMNQQVQAKANELNLLATANPEAYSAFVKNQMIPPEQWEVMTPEQKAELGLPVDDPLRRNVATNLVQRIGQPGIQLDMAGTTTTLTPAESEALTGNPYTVVTKDRTGGTKTQETTKSKAYAKFKDAQSAGSAYEKALDELQRLVNIYGTGVDLWKNPVARDAIDGAILNVQFATQKAQELGALSGADIELATRATGNPQAFLSSFAGPERLAARLNQAKRRMRGELASLAEPYNFEIPENLRLESLPLLGEQQIQAPAPVEAPQMTDEEFASEAAAREEAINRSRTFSPRGNPLINR